MDLLRRIREGSSKYLALERQLRALLLTTLATNFAGSLYGSLLGLYATKNLGVSILAFGLMSTFRDLTSSLASLPSGILSDDFGRKKMAMLAIGFSASNLVLLLSSKDHLLVFLAFIFQGLGSAFMGPSSSAYVIDVIPKERRGKAYATLAFLQSISSIVATSVAGTIAILFGFSWLFGLALAFESIAFCVAALYLEESLRNAGSKAKVEEGRPRESPYGKLKGGFAVLKSPFLLAVLFGIVFHMLGLGIQGPYMVIYASDVLAFSLPSISLVLSAEQLGIFIGHLPSGRIVDKYGGEIAFAFHIIATSPSMILFTASGNPAMASVILFFWGLTFGLDNVSRQSLIAKYRSSAGVATAYGVISLISGIVALISPVVGGWIWTEFAPQAVFYVSAAVNVVGSLPLFILWLHNRK
ncbi:MAG: MFS transporter [Candidatus Brockarchaeota archaeon]|nr:MFS transporter [Candidatus Brockarchaeota archaeon]